MSTAAPEPQSADATAAVATIAESNHVLQYNRQDSTESGWDNPFRPGGELSREAEQIVELIKEGKPITPTSLGPTESQQLNDSNNSAAVTVPDGVEQTVVQANSTPVAASNKSAVNGNKPSQTSPAPIDVKRDTVGVPVDGTQVEHVVLKKKQKRCKCCVIQ